MTKPNNSVVVGDTVYLKKRLDYVTAFSPRDPLIVVDVEEVPMDDMPGAKSLTVECDGICQIVLEADVRKGSNR